MDMMHMEDVAQARRNLEKVRNSPCGAGRLSDRLQQVSDGKHRDCSISSRSGAQSLNSDNVDIVKSSRVYFSLYAQIDRIRLLSVHSTHLLTRYLGARRIMLPTIGSFTQDPALPVGFLPFEDFSATHVS